MTARAYARRAAVAVVLLGGLLGVTACQTHIGTAAYVGNTRISDTQVDGLVTETLSEITQQPTDAQFVQLRQSELTRLILEIGFTQISSKQNVAAPTDAEIGQYLQQQASQASQSGHSASTSSAADRLGAEITLQATAVAKKLSTTVHLTETDLQRAYAASGAQAQGYTYAQVRSQLSPLAYQELAVQAAAQTVSKLGVTVNPRYGTFDAANLVSSATDDFVRVQPTASPSSSTGSGSTG